MKGDFHTITPIQLSLILSNAFGSDGADGVPIDREKLRSGEFGLSGFYNTVVLFVLDTMTHQHPHYKANLRATIVICIALTNELTKVDRVGRIFSSHEQSSYSSLLQGDQNAGQETKRRTRGQRHSEKDNE